MYKEGRLQYNWRIYNESVKNSQCERELALPGVKGEIIRIAGTVYIDRKNDRVGIEDVFNENEHFYGVHLNFRELPDSIRKLIELEEGKIIEVEGEIDDYESTYRVDGKKYDCTKRCLKNVRVLNPFQSDF